MKPGDLAARISDRQLAHARLIVVPTPVADVVSCHASIRTHPEVADNEAILQDLVVSALDKGSRRRDLFAISDELERRGAQLGFYSAGLHVGATWKSLRGDAPVVFDLMAEQMWSPALDREQVEKERALSATRAMRAADSAAIRADAALTRAIYSPGHPNYTPDPLDEAAFLNDISAEAVVAYHSRHFGSNELAIVVTGDADADELSAAFAESLSKVPTVKGDGGFATSAPERGPSEQVVHMEEKAGIEVRFGHALGLTRLHADYVPLYVANFILGGNFSSRLMRIVRDERGLTYTTRSMFSGVSREFEHYWAVAISLSRAKLEEGVGAVREVVRDFVADGVSNEELNRIKTTITGGFQVGLGTTAGLARTLHRFVRWGLSPSYVDRFPEEVDALSLDQVNEAIFRHLDADRLSTAMAGEVEST